MRFHKAIEISRPEADFIIRMSPGSDVVVMSHSDSGMMSVASRAESSTNLSPICLRAEMAHLRAGCVTPH